MLTCKVGTPLQLGVRICNNEITFAASLGKVKECSLLLFRKNTKTILHELPFTPEMIQGNVAAMTVSGIRPESFDYAYRMDGEIITDPYSKKIRENGKWGTLPQEPVTSPITIGEFDWQKDAPLQIPFQNTILYRLHVRGFTKDKTSKCRNKGTFRGITEKIDYFKELGITMIELMPAYDFCEVMQPSSANRVSYAHDYGENKDDYMINYWGYTSKGFYFAPKTAYAADRKDAPGELKEMVRRLHENGIEVCMEFYFDFDANPVFVLNCLQYWVTEYHLDGIHLFASDVVMQMLKADPILARTKIFSWSLEGLNDEKYQICKHMASFNDGFMMTARKFLKGDEGQTGEMQHKLRYNPKYIANVNYIATHSTFTLMDLVSYDRRHNEANGEGNADGAEYNYSWNCGEEGPSKKRRIVELRKKQMKNALAFVMTAQGVPMLYAGDEFGNSQLGNNNPYCQDNEIGWVNWKPNVVNKEIFEYTKQLIAFRKAHPILHMSQELKGMDYLSCGLPDISYHGNNPWYSEYDYVNRHFAVMYCGAYTKEDGLPEDDDLYVAYNMHWEPQSFGLPKPRERRDWTLCFSTEGKGCRPEAYEQMIKEKMVLVPPRSIVVLKAVKNEQPVTGKRKKK